MVVHFPQWSTVAPSPKVAMRLGKPNERHAVQQPVQADALRRVTPLAVRKRRAASRARLNVALYGPRMNDRSEFSVSRLWRVTPVGAFVQPAGPAPRAPFERCHAQRPCLRKLPTALPRAVYQVSGKKVAGPTSTRFRGGPSGRRILRSASIATWGPKVVPLRPQLKSRAMPSNKAIKPTHFAASRRLLAQASRRFSCAAYRQR
jgi:hypothetical protein